MKMMYQVVIFVSMLCSPQTPSYAGITFGTLHSRPCTHIGVAFEIREQNLIEKMGAYRAMVERLIANAKVEALTGPQVSLERIAPKSREVFLAEASEARARDPRMFSKIQIFESISRIDHRPPAEVADAGGIFGGNPSKPTGTLYQHTTINDANNSHGTSSYTSVAIGNSQANLKNEFLLGRYPSKIILKSGEILDIENGGDFYNKLSSESLRSEMDGAVAVWESYLYHGKNVEGVAVSGGANAHESEVITRGFVPVAVQSISVFQPLVVNRKDGSIYPPRLPFERAGMDFLRVTDVVLGPMQSFEWLPAKD